MTDEIGYSEYYNNGRAKFLSECLLTPEALQPFIDQSYTTGFICIHLNTRGENNIVATYPSYNRLYKHIFLQTGNFKSEIVDHYRKLGFGWVDIVPLNRLDWKIFLWPKEQTQNNNEADQAQAPQKME